MLHRFVCPICGAEHTEEEEEGKYDLRLRSRLKIALGSDISPVMYKSLCEDCRETVLYKAVNGLLGPEERRKINA